MPIPEGQYRQVSGPDWNNDFLIQWLVRNGDFQIETDNEGQVIIYTGLYCFSELGLAVLE